MTRRSAVHLILAVLFTACPFGTAIADEADRVQQSIAALRALAGIANEDIPSHLLARAEAIVVIPKFTKGGFIIGAEHGKGIMSARDRATGTWSAPTFVKMSGGNFGLQIGVQSVELVFLVMDRKGVEALLNDKFTMGGDVSVAAGPVGRSASAQTSGSLEAEILAYSRSKGLFAGASLNGTSLSTDDSAIKKFYGRELTSREILAGKVTATEIPSVAQEWRKTLAQLASARKAPKKNT